MIYTIPKLISLDSLNSTYKEASGALCGNGSSATTGCVDGVSPTG